jgi:hypothetical protein
LPEISPLQAKTGEMSTPPPPNQPETSRRDVLLLAHQLNLQHPLVKLCESIDWRYFEQEFGFIASNEMRKANERTY